MAFQLQILYSFSGKILRIEVLSSPAVRWSADGWRTTNDLLTRDTGLGVHVAETFLLHIYRLAVKLNLSFTGRMRVSRKWDIFPWF
jgi:hypothetical protein